MGLMLCVVAGADLFTSNCMYAAVAVWEGGGHLLALALALQRAATRNRLPWVSVRGASNNAWVHICL